MLTSKPTAMEEIKVWMDYHSIKQKVLWLVQLSLLGFVQVHCHASLTLVETGDTNLS